MGLPALQGRAAVEEGALEASALLPALQPALPPACAQPPTYGLRLSQIVALSMRPVTDFNEITYHYLEVPLALNTPEPSVGRASARSTAVAASSPCSLATSPLISSSA